MENVEPGICLHSAMLNTFSAAGSSSSSFVFPFFCLSLFFLPFILVNPITAVVKDHFCWPHCPFSLCSDRQTNRWGRLIDICRKTKAETELLHWKWKWIIHIMLLLPLLSHGIAIITKNVFLKLSCNTDCVYVCTRVSVWYQVCLKTLWTDCTAMIFSFYKFWIQLLFCSFK